MRNRLYFDGGARPTNPGPAGYACVLYLPDGRVIPKAAAIGWHSNNYAEYMGLVIGIKLAIEYMDFSREVDIFTDSKLVWGHMTQGWKRNVDELRMLIRDAERLLHKHYENDETGEKRWDIQWVKRSENAVADEACTMAIQRGRHKNPNPFSVSAGVR